jgi:hypothetical protein
MEYLYHITKEKYVSNIITNGLQINSNKNGFVHRDYLKYYKDKYGMQPIFLTSDIQYVIDTQLTPEFIQKHRCYVIKIKVDSLQIENEYQYMKDDWQEYYDIDVINKSWDKCFICRTNIDFNLIEEVIAL